MHTFEADLSQGANVVKFNITSGLSEKTEAKDVTYDIPNVESGVKIGLIIMGIPENDTVTVNLAE